MNRIGDVVYATRRGDPAARLGRHVNASTSEPRWYCVDEDRWVDSNDIVVDHSRVAPAVYLFGGLTLHFVAASALGAFSVLGASWQAWAVTIGVALVGFLAVVARNDL